MRSTSCQSCPCSLGPAGTNSIVASWGNVEVERLCSGGDVVGAMLVRPTYHIHISEYIGTSGSQRFPEKLFSSPQSTLATPSAPPTERPDDIDARCGPIEVHFVQVRRRARRRMSGPSTQAGNETFGRFQEVDSFQVEPAQDEWSDAEVQHDVRISFGIVHLFRTLADDVSSAGDTEPPPADDEEAIGTILSMLSVPVAMTVSSLLDFVEPALEAIQNMRIVRYVLHLTQPCRPGQQHCPVQVP